MKIYNNFKFLILVANAAKNHFVLKIENFTLIVYKLWNQKKCNIEAMLKIIKNSQAFYIEKKNHQKLNLKLLILFMKLIINDYS